MQVGIEDVRADIESYVASCNLFEEYMAELGKLAHEDWISFRQRLWVLDDFVIAWADRAKECPPGAVADHLRRELSRYKEVAPLLRFVRGESFQAEHWGTLFRKLEIEKVRLDKLCLGL